MKLNKNWVGRILYLILFVSFLIPELLFAQTVSNAGNEFWVAFPTHSEDNDLNGNPLYANLSLFITGNASSSGVVTVGSFSQAFQVAAGSVTEILIPRTNAYINDYESGKVLPGRAVHVVVDPGKPKVALYAHIYAGNRSAASLILPRETLGRQYYSINYQQHDTEGKNFITIVATEPQTRIHLKKGNQELVSGGVLLNDVNDVYEYLSPDDLTGVAISVDTITSACKHFAVFSGSSGVYIDQQGCTPTSLDPLFQQDLPLPSWGKNYGYIPFSKLSPFFTDSVRTAGQYIRILASENGTQVKIDGVDVALLNAGEYFTTPTPLQSAAGISASNPVCVAQYALTQSCSGTGTANGYSDPDMVILNPIVYSVKDITVFSSHRENIKEQYLNVLIKTASASSFLINNKAPSVPFIPISTLPGYSSLQLNLNKDSTNTYHLQAADGFNAIAYGFGNVESYSYSAGTNLNASQAISGILISNNTVIDSACLNDNYDFKLTLPYKSPRISWQMDKNEATVVINNPVSVKVVINGLEAYEYRFPKTPAYRFPGTHIITILADPTDAAAGCSTTKQQIDYSFNVIPLPDVSFTAIAGNCTGNMIFRNKTIIKNSVITAWAWDFGDPSGGADNNISTLKEPSHTFSGAGTYLVKLTAFTASGCQSTRADTLIIKKIKPAIINLNKGCTGRGILLKDTGSYTGFIPLKRIWYFGDGDSTIVENKPDIAHTYASPGTYHIKLLLVNEMGCKSDTGFLNLTIDKIPPADFLVPKICVTDAFAQFKNITLQNGDTGTLSYFWNFGDPNANAGNPGTSTEENPKHKYVASGKYTVSLKVTTVQGCDTTITKDFNVNGVVPRAVFGLNRTRLCSGEPLVLTDKSAVTDFGSITRLELYFDAVNHPNEKITVDTFSVDHTYTHLYPSLGGVSDSLNYMVKMVAFSGTACADSASQIVTIFPLPQVRFSALNPVCLFSKPFQLVQASEVSGVKGDNGIYTGDGVSAEGKFDPSAAGTGVHSIRYTFTSVSGCTDTVSQQIVVTDAPVVNFKNDLTLLQGEFATLEPVYQGMNLTYHWEPATGLSNSNVSNPVISPLQNIKYTVTVSNGTCETSAIINVNVLKPIHIYNTFTPNGDGINDLWNIPELNNYPGATVNIFDRYGHLLYYSIGYPNPWDGTFNGKKLSVGTYYYIIDPKNGLKTLAGYVTLIR
jgi:gliding motility-associated-like protein